ncbi:MAG TPA: deoxyribodipyrimidine photo-lyase [Myxococcaceae bacterium]|nr:deoxyribodipyrimidine photo-lyase [Myxococcaceae bacterium]
MPNGFSWTEIGVDPARVRVVRDAPLPSRGEYVLYWCMVNQRVPCNHALQAAIALGNRLRLPVICYHALRPDYPHASDRLHAFVLQGLDELGNAMRARGVPSWLELPRNTRQHVPRLAALGKRAAAVVSDWFPAFIIPGHLRGAARALEVPLVAVDASCVVPMQRIPEKQVGAYTIRPKLRKLWPEYLGRLPRGQDPEHAREAERVDLGFAPEKHPERLVRELDGFDIDHSVAPVKDRPGGRDAALRSLRVFVRDHVARFDEARNDPGQRGQSGVSAALHWGLLFAGEVARACIDAHGADQPGVASFLEELLVRRELGFNYCLHTPVHDQLRVASLPGWAQQTLARHAKDRREHLYTLDQLDRGETSDPLWNAAQRQLREDGRIHGYLRMLWGKKILEWSPSPQEALERMAHLNDRYALDGRDAVSVANFMWVLGLHDRPFQERPVLGKVRPMSSARTAQKVDLGPYLARYGGADAAGMKLPRRRTRAAAAR